MKRFTRQIENFICENCDKEVKGDGYTNHCPNCLYSKHVDKNPGDRLAQCGGIMRPTILEKGRKGFIITFVCEKCRHVRRNRTSDNDNTDMIVKISNGQNIKRGR